VKGNRRYRKNEDARAQKCRSRSNVKETVGECVEWGKGANIKGKEAEEELESINVKLHVGVGKVGIINWR